VLPASAHSCPPITVIRFEDNSNWQDWIVERRSDGVILVRVPSKGTGLHGRLPDAVFSFRDGDPQYSLWVERLAGRDGGAA
jgi:hypothetical protein